MPRRAAETTIAEPKAAPTPMGMELLSSSCASGVDAGGTTSVVGVAAVGGGFGIAGMKVVRVPGTVKVKNVVLPVTAVGRSSVVSVGFGFKIGDGGGDDELGRCAFVLGWGLIGDGVGISVVRGLVGDEMECGTS